MGKFLRFCLFFVFVLLPVPKNVRAYSETGYDLIAVINTLRASQGLEPYQIDPWLMDYAQQHSDYQASTQTSTHLHSDGTLPKSIGLQENVAGLMVEIASVNIVVYEIWVDYGHRKVLTGYSSGTIGAGVALSKDGMVYYTIDLRPGDESGVSPSGSGTAIVEESTPNPVIPITTSLPSDDGAVIHEVGYGQSLWSIAIAYGVKINDIRALNNIAQDSTSIYTGQKLLIKYVPTPTPAQIETETPSFIQTPVPSAAQITETIPPTTTVVQTASINTPSTTLPSKKMSMKDDGWLFFLGLGILGVIVVVIFGYWKPR